VLSIVVVIFRSVLSFFLALRFRIVQSVDILPNSSLADLTPYSLFITIDNEGLYFDFMCLVISIKSIGFFASILPYCHTKKIDLEEIT